MIDDDARKLLEKSIKDTGGLVQAPIWNERTGNLVGGHQRMKILDAVNKTDDYKITVCVVDWDLAKEKEVNVRMNNPNVGGQYDANGLTALFAEAGGVENLQGFGFDAVSIEALYLDAGLGMPQELLMPEIDNNETVSEAQAVANEIEQVRKIAKIKAKKQKLRETSVAVNCDQVMLPIVFVSLEEQNRFLAGVEMNLASQTISGRHLAAILEIDLESDK